MLRRSFVVSAAAAAAAPAPPASPALLISAAELARMQSGAAGHAAALRTNARSAMKKGPWSVTFARPEGRNVSAAPNDYYSEGPYWWPDPRNPQGPYVRKDGEHNPHRFTANRSALGDLCENALALGMAAGLLGDRAAAERLAHVLSVWFADTKTRMNPHLEFGQAVRGHNTGRGAGIIDTVGLIYCALGVSLAAASGLLPQPVTAGVRDWYRAYLKWITTSEKGLQEKKAGNNHATWWTAQAAAFATFTQDAANRRMAWEHYRTWLVPQQVQPDGSCPREEARTRSLSYSAMNLDGFAVLCRLGDMDGGNLWRFQPPKGAGIEKSFHYLMPFVVDPGRWSKPQIAKFDQDRTVYLGLAGLGLKSPELLAAYRKLPRAGAPWVQFVDLLVKTSQ